MCNPIAHHCESLWFVDRLLCELFPCYTVNREGSDEILCIMDFRLDWNWRKKILINDIFSNMILINDCRNTVCAKKGSSSRKSFRTTELLWCVSFFSPSFPLYLCFLWIDAFFIFNTFQSISIHMQNLFLTPKINYRNGSSDSHH